MDAATPGARFRYAIPPEEARWWRASSLRRSCAVRLTNSAATLPRSGSSRQSTRSRPGLALLAYLLLSR